MASYVYRAYDDQGVLLYVGLSDKPDGRLDRHAYESPWHQFTATVTREVYLTRPEAAQAELVAIKTERPVYNEIGSSGSLAHRITDYLVRRFSPGEMVGEVVKFEPDELLEATLVVLNQHGDLSASGLLENLPEPWSTLRPDQLGLELRTRGVRSTHRRHGNCYQLSDVEAAARDICPFPPTRSPKED